MSRTNSAPALPPEAFAHYVSGIEQSRLSRGPSQLEFARTCEVILRFIPPPPAVVMDVGGGPGAYACELARRGYEVHLIDAVPLHVEQARQASAAQPQHPIASFAVGDARSIDRKAASVDAVLLLGPLYHLTERPDRLKAWREAARILRPGAYVVAAAVSRYASLLDGLRSGFLDDPAFCRIVERDLTDGQHRNDTDHPHYFTTTYFHRPEDLRDEACSTGLDCRGVFGVEGPAWLVPDFEHHWNDTMRRDRLMHYLRRIEQEPSLLGMSAHLLAVARKP